LALNPVPCAKYGEDNAEGCLLQLLMKARLPFWLQTTRLRPKAQRLVQNCLQYFTLRGKLVDDVVSDGQQASGQQRICVKLLGASSVVCRFARCFPLLESRGYLFFLS